MYLPTRAEGCLPCDLKTPTETAQASVLSGFQLLLPAVSPTAPSGGGHGVEEEVGMLAVGAALWLSREETFWALLQQKQRPQCILGDDLALPCAENKTKGIKQTKVKILSI